MRIRDQTVPVAAGLKDRHGEIKSAQLRRAKHPSGRDYKADRTSDDARYNQGADPTPGSCGPNESSELRPTAPNQRRVLNSGAEEQERQAQKHHAACQAGHSR